jgi:hypothetical protein
MLPLPTLWMLWSEKKINCGNCMLLMETADDVPQNLLIRERESTRYQFVHPSTNFAKAFRHLTFVIYELVPKFVTMYNLKKQIMEVISKEELPVLFCDQHKNEILFFLNITVNFAIYIYIAKMNKILVGKDLSHKDMDVLSQSAYVKYWKKLHK